MKPRGHRIKKTLFSQLARRERAIRIKLRNRTTKKEGKGVILWTKRNGRKSA